MSLFDHATEIDQLRRRTVGFQHKILYDVFIVFIDEGAGLDTMYSSIILQTAHRVDSAAGKLMSSFELDPSSYNAAKEGDSAVTGILTRARDHPNFEERVW
ncbi:uncharacterized protein PV07_02165 [Cladophialophora immunda]|uniref:Uncharacterized protein n=1 Tax=Cladophialophora immunda TaxID=569365 RepID=A0A0D2DIE0_9EURO|nr:uncharacterized protein PV07_02165 [Cladophialophora immunda]KIW35469.1 hypothetical protein PV07_02165 [Cladophialophora immunda]